MKLSTTILLLGILFWILTYQQSEKQRPNKRDTIYDFQQANIEKLTFINYSLNGASFDLDSLNNEANKCTSDWTKLTIRLPVDKEKIIVKDGEDITFRTLVLDEKNTEKIGESAHKNLFKPLDAQQYIWLSGSSNISDTAVGMQLQSFDFTKLDQ